MTIATTDEHKAVQESMRGWAGSVRPIATMRAEPEGFWRGYWPALADLGVVRVAGGAGAGGAGAAGAAPGRVRGKGARKGMRGKG